MGWNGRAGNSLVHITAMLLLISALMTTTGKRAGAQVLPATAGVVGGFLAGTLVMTGTVVLEARLGKYVYGVDEIVQLRPEILPIFIGPVVGGVMGATSPQRLKRTGAGALYGAVGGAALGAVVGDIFWSSSEGRWAGGIIGSAVGVIAGSVINGSRKLDNNSGDAGAGPTLSINIPIGKR